MIINPTHHQSLNLQKISPPISSYKSPETSTTTATASVAATESTMDNESSNHRHNSPKSTALHTTSPLFLKRDETDDGDPEVWAAFTSNFSQVQSVLDRNRSLIQQVNENHRSKIHDNLVKNVELIQEINGNIAKVVSLYSNLSADFSSMFHHRNAAAADGDSKAEEKSSE